MSMRIDRIRTLKKLLKEGTPFIDEYKKLIKLERQEMEKVLQQKRDAAKES